MSVLEAQDEDEVKLLSLFIRKMSFLNVFSVAGLLIFVYCEIHKMDLL